ncbi:MAG TPA: glycoside hydrolase family 3 C-terminal domain-containing protein [Acidobacteriaceae bacterium]|jgi:beta-glucosidase|nr:glycoside hydrolase family 3 C-terminal domain-containing protein [Acidobacteriaceae bacterium]
MKKRIALLVCPLLLAAVPSFAQEARQQPRPQEVDQWHLQHYPFDDVTLPPEQRIDNLLSLMTTDEKIDCLGTITGVPRLGVPNIGNSEGIHGIVQREARFGRQPITTTQFPQPPGMGESWDPDLVRQAADVEGYEARFISQTPQYHRQMLMPWGPQADLDRDPRWGRSEEVYGEDPFFNGTMATAFVHGLQGNDPKYWQSAALLKHFLANENENQRNSSSSNFDERLFWEYYSVPFRMAFTEGGAKAVMASYNAWNGTAMAVNPILRSIVMDQWGVDIISSDGGAVKLLVSPRKLFPNQEAAVVACLKAGINQYLDVYRDELHAALKDGSITQADLDKALRPKFAVELKLGLLDPPDMVPYTKIKDSPEPWNTDRDRDVSRKMALESVVLLKNENSLLPLDKSKIKSIAVIGPLADVVHWDWYGGTPPYAITPLKGIQDAAGPGVKVNFAPYDTQDGEDAAMKAASESDVAVVVVGNNPTCGDEGHAWYNSPTDGGGITLPCTVPSDGREGRDRETIDLYQEQIIKQVFIKNPKTVVMLISSFPYDINWTEANVPAILHMAQSSQDEGTALAKVLFGDFNPGGHLVDTWPQSADQLPPRMDYNIRDGYTYMYFKGQPLYPFGFGLSYTTFKFSNIKTSTPRLAKDGTVTVSVDVTNTGARSGDEVVQLYVQHLHSSVERPREELEGFQRVTVDPGQTKTVDIPLPASRLAYWDVKTHAFRVEAEPVKLMLGDSSANLPVSATLHVQ